MVVALIPLLGMAAVVLTSNSRQILTNTRRTALKTQAQLAAESGIVWIQENTASSLTKEQPLVLTLDSEDKTITCIIELTSQTNKQSVFKVIGCAQDRRFSCKHPQQFILKH